MPNPSNSHFLEAKLHPLGKILDTQPYLEVACIVKLGGSAITHKDQLETLNEAVLDASVEHVGRLHSGLQKKEDEAGGSGAGRVIVVHGAGSFGHFHAAQAGVAQGGLVESDRVLMGFAACRLSVTQLNHHVVTRLIKQGVPACSVSPFPEWICAHRELIETPHPAVFPALLHHRLVPVLHGDGVLDSERGCTILSGDTIIFHLAQQLRPGRVVFLTNVAGVFTRPPEEDGAQLIQAIRVNVDQTWTVTKMLGSDNEVDVNDLDFKCAAHDTTGGIEAKIKEAIMISSKGVHVFIVEAGTEHALRAMQMDLDSVAQQTDWRGTWIHPVF